MENVLLELKWEYGTETVLGGAFSINGPDSKSLKVVFNSFAIAASMESYESVINIDKADTVSITVIIYFYIYLVFFLSKN